ncbi:glycosyl hydrolase family 28-related protein [Paenarthrobacter aurescens]|uniref:Pectate lyase superfamily protein domain-containing protein n=1 Tax=Paenarthrobacter aurescens TaxID=43663 RepID=A0A4Y3NC34_PAEAU|nr:right-handed parallel beta-helix repeat-containing protein [Paenarthrobacter aurescens]MDO6142907.1 right-handed parallel beta-helix repeat-containing protein [Paenarthrobacter aurescens]MDO6146752.1 right-handed parallel beta-helix repeat-containing protein [Paenarthrobacter aurescens]MDO6157998.1 right-handed parallel beta-helix repeat-containing protein [Paenarthrobacter aurescens]MDO6161983.1 right-handed parallel beta-helix repeat-containing protein [Paenarthrobacter aurescens]GEB19504
MTLNGPGSRLGHLLLMALATALLVTGCGSATPLGHPDALAQPDALQRAEPGACDAYGSQATNVKEWTANGYLDAQDTSRSLQQAIDSAAKIGGAIIQLPEGVFTLERPLVIKSNVSLRGSGPDTVLKAGPDFLEFEGPFGGHPLITTNGAQNVTISWLTADQNGEELEGNLPGRLREYLVDVRHSTNALVQGVTTRNPYTYSIAVVASSNFCVRESRTTVTSSDHYDQLDGIHITDSHDGLVEGNTVDQRQGADGDDGLVAQALGAPVHHVIYRNNDVRGGSHGSGLQLALSTHEIHNITVDGNRFWGSPDGLITGYYDGGHAAVRDVTVRNNEFFNLQGPWLNFSGDLENIEVTNNLTCQAGTMMLEDAPGNVVAGNFTRC